MNRHLIYHVYPARGSNWRQRLRALADRWELFDGSRSIAVSVDHGSDGLGEVKGELPSGAEFRSFQNCPDKRELVSWSWLWDRALSAASDSDAILRGHAKGVSRPAGPCQIWARLCESLCLDHWSLVRRQLAARPITGPFRVLTTEGWNEDGKCDWLYTGSWYWVLAGAARSRNLIPKPNSWGVESWPGREFARNESAVIFGDLMPVASNDLYTISPWDDSIIPQYQKWRVRNPPDRLPMSEPLHIVTPCSRPYMLPRVAESLGRLRGIDYRWHVVSSPTPGFGGSARMTALREIVDGWVYFLDDDNAIHPRLGGSLVRALKDYPGADGFVFGQQNRDGSRRLAASVSGRTGEIDSGQFVLRRASITSQWGDGYTADADFFREVAKGSTIVPVEEYATFWNALAD